MCCDYQTTQGIQCGCSFYVRFVILCGENVNARCEFVSCACCTRACTLTSRTKTQTRHMICLAGFQQPLQSCNSDVFQNQSWYWTSSTSILCLVFLVKWKEKIKPWHCNSLWRFQRERTQRKRQRFQLLHCSALLQLGTSLPLHSLILQLFFRATKATMA